MAAPDEFTLQIAAFVAKAGKRADVAVRKVALDMFTRVILKSPVDTGRFRGNWQVTIGLKPVPQIADKDKGGGATIAKAQALVGQAKAGDVIALSNSLPYARALEYGHSKQAPAGMVRITVAEFNLALNKGVAQAKQEVP